MGMSFDCLKKVIIDFVEYIDENEWKENEYCHPVEELIFWIKRTERATLIDRVIQLEALNKIKKLIKGPQKVISIIGFIDRIHLKSQPNKCSCYQREIII
jgi:hypothetical protein